VSKYCQTHVKERTDEELKARFRDIKGRAARGEKVGPGLARELRNITSEWAERVIVRHGDVGMESLDA